ncbi:hypothetical protein AAFF_G00370900 [Aldrovandia affinis]|uniref:Uncharacterized protein n=1 Tax=Aldrovandia affinis TaxID=143900 RepID=A0AAD7WMJ6_9TELE|nr:hypothetical protein AAFF_G00370900 [Aldrovandia affinis]
MLRSRALDGLFWLSGALRGVGVARRWSSPSLRPSSGYRKAAPPVARSEVEGWAQRNERSASPSRPVPSRPIPPHVCRASSGSAPLKGQLFLGVPPAGRAPALRGNTGGNACPHRPPRNSEGALIITPLTRNPQVTGGDSRASVCSAH